MPKISTIIYSIRQGFKGLRRNNMFSLASIGTMTACLFLFGIFFYLMENVQYSLKQAETNVGVTVFFDEGTSEERIGQIKQLTELRVEVAYVKYITAEQAWEQYKATSLTEEQIASFGDDNPLENSASLEVHFADVSMQDALTRYLASLEGVRKIVDSGRVADTLSGFNKAIRLVSLVITAILIAVAIFLISTTISTGVTIRKQEITIMKLIGATDFVIKAPFYVEGLALGVIGAAIPLTMLYAVYYKVTAYAVEKLDDVFGKSSLLLDSGEVFHKLVPIALAIGIGIGLVGTGFTLRRQLRKIN